MLVNKALQLWTENHTVTPDITKWALFLRELLMFKKNHSVLFIITWLIHIELFLIVADWLNNLVISFTLIFLLSFLLNYHLNGESFLPYPFKTASTILQIFFGQKDLCLNTSKV